jgi:hypothetical protein
MQTTIFKKGDKVRHRRSPEWGTGVISRTEMLNREGGMDMRLWVRFPSVGEKVLLASIAPLDHVTDGGAAEALDFHSRPSVAEAAQSTGGGWLAEISKSKPEDVMTAVPLEATDPFVPAPRRLANALALYRFDGSGVKLIEWAVAQSGLDDPMTRYNRQELEAQWKRWLFNLDNAVLKILQELRRDQASIQAALAKAPPLAKKVVPRLLANMR